MKNLIFVGLMFFGFACNFDSSHHTENQKTVVEDILKNHPKVNVSVDLDRTETIKNFSPVKVTKHVDVPFYTTGRAQIIKSYACVECHDANFKSSVKRGEDPVKAHWNISMSHADKNTLNCASCHGSADKTTLTTLNGAKVSFDKPYLTCAQCHNNQVKDWKNGAHGKDVGGWAPPRMVKNCTECHNPHNPSFPVRFPSRFIDTKISDAY